MITTIVPPVLTSHDCCDRCSAPAKVRALLRTGGELLFCGHHAREHVPRLQHIGAALAPPWPPEEATATPPAIRASAVRIQARKVRSLASVKR